MKEQQRIINNQGKVTIQEVQLEDEGEYECNINHLREGREESTSHEVVVRIKVRLEWQALFTCHKLLIGGVWPEGL